MSSLSEQNITMVENFIASNKPTNSIRPSESDRYSAIEQWKKISDPNTPNTFYSQFGSNAFGMTSYGFYKSKTGELYVITAFINNVTSYFKVDNTWDFLQDLTPSD